MEKGKRGDMWFCEAKTHMKRGMCQSMNNPGNKLNLNTHFRCNASFLACRLQSFFEHIFLFY